MVEIISEFTVRRLIDRGLRESFITGAAFGLVFTGYYTLTSYQTSVNQLLGYLSLGIWYGFFCLGSFFSPYLLKYLSEKYLFIIGCSIHALYIFANIRVYPWILLPAAALVGLGGSIIWTVYGAYIEKVSEPRDLGKTNGIFWGLYISSIVIGNLLASILLMFWDTTVLFIVLGIISCSGCLLFLLLEKPQPSKFQVEGLGETVKRILGFFQEVPMLLMVPATINIGFLYPLMYGKYTLYIEQKQIGFYFAAYGGAEVLSGFVFGKLSDVIGRVPIFYIGYVLIVLGIGMASFGGLFILGGLILIGAGDAANQTQVAVVITKLQWKYVTSAFSWKTIIYAITCAIMYIAAPYIPYEIMQLIVAGIYTVGMLCILILDRFINIKKADSDSKVPV